MLVLQNMDPTHRHGSSSLPRALLRYTTSIATRLSTLAAKVVIMALAMLLVPRMMHTLVLCLDDLYEALGRRAASPWETQALFGNGMVIGLVVMLALHTVLMRLSYCTILDKDPGSTGEKGKETAMQKPVTWERVLMRIIVPLLLCGGLFLIFWSLWGLGGKKELIRANTVDVTDDASAGLIWRDR